MLPAEPTTPCGRLIRVLPELLRIIVTLMQLRVMVMRCRGHTLLRGEDRSLLQVHAGHDTSQENGGKDEWM